MGPSLDRLQSAQFIVWLAFTLALGFCLFSPFAWIDRSIAVNTIYLGVGSAAIALPLGIIVAWVASGRSWLCRAVFASCIALLIVPLFAHVSAWDSAFGRLGWLTAIRGQVLTPLVSSWASAIWIHAIAAAPAVAVIVLLGLATGRRTFEEQALLETSQLSVFWHVTVPRISPLILLGAVWVLVSCAREIAVTDIYRIGTLAEQVYLGFSLGQFDSIRGNWSDDQLAAAQSLGIFVSVATLGWIILSCLWLFTRLTSLAFESSHWRPARVGRQESGWLRNTIAVGVLTVLVLIPAGNLIFRASFRVDSVAGVPTPNHTAEQLLNSLGRVFLQYQIEFTWSLVIAAVAATVILIAGVWLTWQASRSTKWQITFVIALTVSFAIPGPLIGLGLSRIFSAVDVEPVIWFYDRTILAPVVASSLFCWPIAGLIVWFAFRKTAVDCLENARLEGVTHRQQLLLIVVPANRYILLGCWLISFALCFGELSASQMVLPPGMDTVPRTTLGLLHAGVDEMTAALTIVTTAVIVVLSGIGYWFVGLQPRRVG